MKKILFKTAFRTLMRILTIFCIICTSAAVLLANGTSAQSLRETNISVRLDDASLVEAFRLIEEETDFRFMYQKGIKSLPNRVSLHVNDESLEFVLKSISQQAAVSFKQVNSTISVKKNDVGSNRSSSKKSVNQASKKVSGRIVDSETGEELIGATVKVKGTQNGSVTDISGRFSLVVADDDETLVVTYIGYVAEEISIGAQTVFDISMQADVSKLNEVVVTALNLEREQKSIGYSTQKVSGVAIREASEPNLLSTLSGKIAGAQITNTNGGVGSSSTIVLRGYASLSGRNQPLFIVDGIPISNEVHQTSRAFGGPSNPNQSGFLGEGQASDEGGAEVQVDFGNAAAEINPQDIESIQVLKGATAAALYGSRAANGVILITTKSGKGQKGLGVTFSTNISFQTPLKTPEFQTLFGKGSNGLYDSTNPDLANSARNFGPRFNGQTINQYDPNNPEVARSIPWVNRLGSDPIGDFLETGVTQNYSISVMNGSEKGNFRLSYSRLEQKGMVPNTDLYRNSLSLNAKALLSKRLTISTSVNYVNSGSGNRPEIGAKNSSNLVYTFLRTGTNESLGELRDYWEPFGEGVRQATSDRNVNNPYFLAYENVNGNSRHRVFGNVQANYDFTEELSLQVRAGRDFYRDSRFSRKAISHFPYTNGFYAEANVFYLEENTDFLLTYQKDFGQLSLRAIAGGNRLDQRTEELRADTGFDGIVVPGLFNLSNSRSPVQSSNFLSRKRINSLYAGVTLGLNDYLFLDITGRNDWSSTLPRNNNSYFYPSASLSGIISDMLDLNLTSTNDYIKARLSYAEVGNDTDPYSTNVITINGSTVEGTSVNSINGRLGNPNLKPERIKSTEIGIETSLFNNRVFIDATAYTSETKQQIARIPVASESGFLERTINVPATITNKGIELSATITPIKAGGFKWDLTANWAKNVNEISGLNNEEGERITLAERWINLDIEDGGKYGNFYGDGLLKVDENGNFSTEGSQVYRPDGRAEESDDGDYGIEAKPLLGNGIPDWVGGINNTFSYKNFSFSFLFDVNYGGEVHSRTFVIGNNFGALKESVEVFDRDNADAAVQAAEEGNNVTEGEHWVILDGAVIDRSTGEIATDEDFAARTQNVYRRYFDNDAIGTFDRTFVKLREVKLSYRLPSKLTESLSIQNATFTVYGRNLLLWDNLPHIDPEAAGYSGELIGGEFFALPSARSFGFSLTANF